tara:strand:+ start:232 stop:615 length:384 start_codon:yes stop_codon:yes gene_type:complete
VELKGFNVIKKEKNTFDFTQENPNNLDIIKIYLKDLDGTQYTVKIFVEEDTTLMDILKRLDFPMGHCGGMALCASCHCYIEGQIKLLNKSEEDMLDQLHNSDENSRLACQVLIKKELDGLVIRIPSN